LRQPDVFDKFNPNDFQEALQQVNASATSRAQQIRKWCLLPADVSVKGGEIGGESQKRLRLCVLRTTYKILSIEKCH